MTRQRSPRPYLDDRQVHDLGFPPPQLVFVLPRPTTHAQAHDRQLRLGAQARAPRVIRRIAQAAEREVAPAAAVAACSASFLWICSQCTAKVRCMVRHMVMTGRHLHRSLCSA